MLGVVPASWSLGEGLWDAEEKGGRVASLSRTLWSLLDGVWGV